MLEMLSSFGLSFSRVKALRCSLKVIIAHCRSFLVLVTMNTQCTKKVVLDRPGLVDFAIGLVNSVLNFPNGQVKYFKEFDFQKNCEINSAQQKMTFFASLSLYP